MKTWALTLRAGPGKDFNATAAVPAPLEDGSRDPFADAVLAKAQSAPRGWRSSFSRYFWALGSMEAKR
jgi:hypothetical protein